MGFVSLNPTYVATYSNNTTNAWNVNLNNGSVNNDNKTNTYYVLVVLAHAALPANVTNAKGVLWAQQTAGANTWTATVDKPITWRDEVIGNFRFDVEVVPV